MWWRKSTCMAPMSQSTGGLMGSSISELFRWSTNYKFVDAACLALVRGVTQWPSPHLSFGIEMQNGASDGKLIVRSCGCHDMAAVSPWATSQGSTPDCPKASSPSPRTSFSLLALSPTPSWPSLPRLQPHSDPSCVTTMLHLQLLGLPAPWN